MPPNLPAPNSCSSKTKRHCLNLPCVIGPWIWLPNEGSLQWRPPTSQGSLWWKRVGSSPETPLPKCTTSQIARALRTRSAWLALLKFRLLACTQMNFSDGTSCRPSLWHSATVSGRRQAKANTPKVYTDCTSFQRSKCLQSRSETTLRVRMHSTKWSTFRRKLQRNSDSSSECWTWQRKS